ncbi:zeta toxin family protein [Rathayibacter oskolensis]|uniref:zeta toxin family protein n=1 Tax=Rathayibacter oskolensis TaxID=1891671 RepID=UPI003466EC4C
MRDGLNVVIDTVLSSPEKVVELGQRLGFVGYSVEVIDVEVPFELSESRIAGRWQQSYERALDGADELGGRWVPSEYARGVYAGPDGRSLPELAAERLADTGPTLMRYRRYSTPAEGHPRTIDVDKSRTAFGEPLIDTPSPKHERPTPAASPRRRRRRRRTAATKNGRPPSTRWFDR